MDIKAQKLGLIAKLLKVENEAVILKVKALLDFAEEAEKAGELSPMSLETFYQKLSASEEAIEKGEIISQENLRRKVESWKER
ncbi:MAG: hypothetical protein AAFR61_12110 [Bacteroidota bacterium]